MKKIYMMALAVALGAAGATAESLTAQIIKPAVRTVRSLDVKRPFGTAGAGVEASSALKAPERAESRWESIGTGRMKDDILGGFVQVNVSEYEVDVMEDKANPGMYRIVDPWKNNPYYGKLPAQISLSLGESYYITIDATNPAYVRVLRSPVGLADEGGPADLMGVTEGVGLVPGLTQEMADSYAGKLENGNITFPVIKSLMLVQGNDPYTTNYEGAFSLALPGAESPIDYKFNVERKEWFCPDDDGNFHVAFIGDDRIAAIRYRLMTSLPQYEDEATALIADIAANGTVAEMNKPVTVSVKDVRTRTVTLVAVSVDGSGAPQEAIGLNMTVPFEDAGGWELLGKASFTEGFISGVLPMNFDVETYEVDVERNNTNPGLIRIVDPYKGWSAAGQFHLDHNHSHYIYFNIEDVDNVYVLTSPLGIRMDPYGEFGISSDYAEIVEAYGKDLCTIMGITSGGTYREGIIEFNADCDIKILPVNWGEYIYTNFKENPEYDEAAADAAAAAGKEYDVPEYLPGDFRLDMSKAGIGSVAVDLGAADGTAIYYNLQGQRVDHPVAGTVCIRVQNGKSTKVQIR